MHSYCFSCLDSWFLVPASWFLVLLSIVYCLSSIVYLLLQLQLTCFIILQRAFVEHMADGVDEQLFLPLL
jgi:hypothetical protein